MRLNTDCWCSEGLHFEETVVSVYRRHIGGTFFGMWRRRRHHDAPNGK
jgi:hypothetical protein